MKKIILLSFFIFSCHSSIEKSFYSLNDAFFNWYFKFNPIKSLYYKDSKINNFYRNYTNNDNLEYIADISRFIIELSQIDATKLSINDKIDYNILYFNLERLIYEMTSLKEWEWNPYLVIDQIYRILLYVSESNSIDMRTRINYVEKNLEYIPNILYSFKKNIIYYSKIHSDLSIHNIDNIIELINQIPLKLNADNITLDKIDKSIEKVIKSLFDFKEWLSYDISTLDRVNYPQDLNLLDNGFKYFVGDNYKPQRIYLSAERKKTALQNQLFEVTLPMYLKVNDEPVWLDREDTLNVIHWVIDYILNKPANQINNNDNILDSVFKSINSIEKFIYENNILSKNILQSIELAIAPHYFIEENFLFDHNGNDLNRNSIYYINKISDDGIASLIFPQLEILNCQNVIPGFSIQDAYAKMNDSKVRYIFPDAIIASAWKHYSLSILIDNKFNKWNNEHYILKLRNELLITCKAILENKYYSKNIKLNEMRSFLKKESFISNKELVRAIEDINFNYFSGTQSFIGMVEINALKIEYKKKYNGEFDYLRFHNDILKNSYIPFYSLKEILLD